MDLNAVRMFARVVETRSFTAAAADLGMTQSGVSRAIERLEADLGVQLLHRTTRSVGISPDGEALYGKTLHLFEAFRDVQQLIADRGQSAAGKLKITAPLALGRIVVMPALRSICERHSGMNIDISLTDRIVDLAEEGFDAAIRIGELSDSGLVARRLTMLRLVTAASPEYLKQRGIPRVPQDILQHNCLTHKFPRTGKPVEWAFREGGKVTRIPARGNLVCDVIEPLVDAAAAGAGLVQTARFMCSRHLESGALVSILEDHVADRGPVYLLYRKSRTRSLKLKALAEALDAVDFD